MVIVRESSDAWERKDAIEERIRRFPRSTITCDGPGCNQRAPRNQCAKCRCSYYCSRECQKKDWLGHKKYCVEVESKRIRPVPYPDDINDIPETACTREAVNVECPICLEQPTRNRIVLKQCRHGFCLSCIVNMYTHYCFVKDVSRRAFCCPYCRVDIDRDVVDDVLERSVYLSDRATNRTTKDSKETKIYLLQKAVECLDVVLSAENPFLVAYYRKAESLVHMGDGQKALETLDLLFQANKTRCDHPITELSKQMLYAGEMKDYLRFELLRETVSEAAQAIGLPTIPFHQDYIFSAYILQGMAYHLLQDLDRAIASFMKANSLLNENPVGTMQSQMKMILASVECYYDAKDYKNILFLIEQSLQFDVHRRFPGIHKWKALALEQMGRIDEAIVTMSRAVLYEAPWDPINQDECLKLFDELCHRHRTGLNNITEQEV